MDRTSGAGGRGGTSLIVCFFISELGPALASSGRRLPRFWWRGLEWTDVVLECGPESERDCTDEASPA